MKTKQRGMTLLELLIAITISLFLLAGLLSIFISMRTTFQSQSGLTQLQDDQRMSMTMLTQITETAGYFGNVQSQLAQQAFPATSPFTSSGQFVYGISGANASTPDTLYVQFQSAQNDSVVNCLGGTNSSSSTPVNYINAFTVNTATLQLTCALNGGTAQALVGGVNTSGSTATACNALGYQGISNIKFLYGVGTTGNGSVTQYSVASAVTNWLSVLSIQATITMLYCAQLGSVPQQIPFSRIIFLPNQQ
ncbi:prepilin-type N-terminal cleavage/methylation domain-containing protein [Neisseriaceae bacterium TC5R-5]|nr:prepilin-type N-terminal cleavage/methylation domain-containing protein [Neisseriaceae bacterium TC5R-5]